MIDILGFSIFDGSKEEYMERLLERFKKGKKTIVISGNPEVLHSISNYDKIMSIIPQCDIIPDGVGILLAGKIKRKPFTGKIAGIDVVEELLNLSCREDVGIYLLGAENWVVEKAAEECRKRYNAKIVGHHHGYFNMEECEDIIAHINESGADVLLVAMGCPRQELFIAKYKDLLCPQIFMGVGGTFDVLSGKVNRAPRWMISAGLEWLYRVYKEPQRIKRLAVIPQFLLRVLFNKRY